MISRKEKYKVNLVWAIGIFIAWELVAFFLEQVMHDPMAGAKLPYPHSVIISIAENFTDLMSAAGLTFSRAVFGFALGAAIGFVLAIIMSLSKIAEKISLPYLIISQMIPVLGLAPIIFTLVRDMNTSRIVIAAYITFFPVSVNMLSGLNSVESDKKELLYSYAAKKKSIYYKLMIPYSMPYLFAGLKIAAPMSITASILVDMLGFKWWNWSETFILVILRNKRCILGISSYQRFNGDFKLFYSNIIRKNLYALEKTDYIGR
ncbi:NitT/TauT family transport system permease protein [Clostridium beijerinckii]|nr:NitT/TauT family transport system permease protein [Clostridium beijerinckii]